MTLGGGQPGLADRLIGAGLAAPEAALDALVRPGEVVGATLEHFGNPLMPATLRKAPKVDIDQWWKDIRTRQSLVDIRRRKALAEGQSLSGLSALQAHGEELLFDPINLLGAGAILRAPRAAKAAKAVTDTTPDWMAKRAAVGLGAPVEPGFVDNIRARHLFGRAGATPEDRATAFHGLMGGPGGSPMSSPYIRGPRAPSGGPGVNRPEVIEHYIKRSALDEGVGSLRQVQDPATFMAPPRPASGPGAKAATAPKTTPAKATQEAAEEMGDFTMGTYMRMLAGERADQAKKFLAGVRGLANQTPSEALRTVVGGGMRAARPMARAAFHGVTGPAGASWPRRAGQTALVGGLGAVGAGALGHALGGQLGGEPPDGAPVEGPEIAEGVAGAIAEPGSVDPLALLDSIATTPEADRSVDQWNPVAWMQSEYDTRRGLLTEGYEAEIADLDRQFTEGEEFFEKALGQYEGDPQVTQAIMRDYTNFQTGLMDRRLQLENHFRTRSSSLLSEIKGEVDMVAALSQMTMPSPVQQAEALKAGIGQTLSTVRENLPEAIQNVAGQVGGGRRAAVGARTIRADPICRPVATARRAQPVGQCRPTGDNDRQRRLLGVRHAVFRDARQRPGR